MIDPAEHHHLQTINVAPFTTTSAAEHRHGHVCIITFSCSERFLHNQGQRREARALDKFLLASVAFTGREFSRWAAKNEA